SLGGISALHCPEPSLPAAAGPIRSRRPRSPISNSRPRSANIKGAQKKTPQTELRGFGVKTLAMTYSRMLGAHYHRRVRVSLPSSEWSRVFPRSYCHQGEGGGSRLIPTD